MDSNGQDLTRDIGGAMLSDEDLSQSRAIGFEVGPEIRNESALVLSIL
jgi:hypothetical protein